MKQCPVCGQKIGRRVSLHFKTNHPEYKWSREIKEGNVSLHYYCELCGQSVSGFPALVEHYNECHSQVRPIKPSYSQVGQQSIAPPAQGIISESTLSVTDLDRLLEQVNINLSLLQEERERNQELLQKCTAYASRIVELQNELARENKRLH